MKIVGKLLLGGVIVFLIIFIVMSIFVSAHGTKIIEEQMTARLKIPVTLEAIKLKLPFVVELGGLQLGGLARVEQLSFVPNPLGLVAGKIVLSDVRLIRPTIHLVQFADGSFNIPVFKQDGKPSQRVSKPPIVYVTGITVKHGKFMFTNQKIAPQGHTLYADRIDANISKVAWPIQSIRINYHASAVIIDAKAKDIGSVSAAGWIDFGPKDMDGVVTVKDVEATAFAPYYAGYISDKKLVSAKLNIASQQKAKNNDLSISTSLKLSQLVYAKDDAAQTAQPSREDLYLDTLDFFADKQGDINFDFSLRTKLDRPSFGPESLKKALGQSAASNFTRQAPGDIIEKVSANIETFKAIGKEFETMFKKKKTKAPPAVPDQTLPAQPAPTTEPTP